jgi:hypothetical protein
MAAPIGQGSRDQRRSNLMWIQLAQGRLTEAWMSFITIAPLLQSF